MMRGITLIGIFVVLASSALSTSPAIASPTIMGSFVDMPDDGWYQVQRADTFQSVCEGQRRCQVTPGAYIVINHTTGQRFDLSTGDSALDASDEYPDRITVSGNRILWPDDGWYQVQNSRTFVSLCEGGRTCTVPDGDYLVINHSTGARSNVMVDGTGGFPPDSIPLPGDESLVVVSGNTIEWPDDGWYQVQDATTYQSICEGGRSCTVANGRYNVINHSNGTRSENIQVSAIPSVDSPDSSLPILKLVAPPRLPSSCIGAVDQVSTRYCVDPDTRIFSATRDDESVWWSFTLPGETESNQIESVLTTDQWVIIIADRFPTLDTLTPDQRANQYEASLFGKNGTFFRTVRLVLDLSLSGSTEPGQVSSRWSSGLLNDPLRVLAMESDVGNPQLVVAWNRWKTFNFSGPDWDMSGISVFDLTSGDRVNTLYFPGRGIEQLSAVVGDIDIIRVVSQSEIDWFYVETLGRVPAQYFSRFSIEALVSAPNGSEPQLNGRNYRDVIARILPWINGDIPQELLYGEINDELPSGIFPVPFDEFASLEQFDEGGYSNALYRCSNYGAVFRRDLVAVPISLYLLDQCQLYDQIYSGKLASNRVGRDGFGTRGENLTIRHSDSDITTASLGYTTGYSRVLDGDRRTYYGSVAGYGLSRAGRNVAVSNYVSGVQFFYGDNIGTETCAIETDSDGQIINRLECKRVRASGTVTGSFSVNADWSSYGSLKVSADLDFGRDYFKQFTWSSIDGSSLPDPIPFDGPTEPLQEFFFSGGAIKITAADGSSIELVPMGEPGASAYQASVRDSAGNESEILPIEIVDVKCAERVGTCTVAR